MITVNIPNVEVMPAPDQRIDAILQYLLQMNQQLASIISNQGAIRMDIQATLDSLTAAKASLAKVAAEQSALVAKVDDLMAQIAAMNDPRLDQIQALAQEVRDQAAGIDASVPDAPPVEEPAPVEPAPAEASVPLSPDVEG
jgi:hypothetical protein